MGADPGDASAEKRGEEPIILRARRVRRNGRSRSFCFLVLIRVISPFMVSREWKAAARRGVEALRAAENTLAKNFSVGLGEFEASG